MVKRLRKGFTLVELVIVIAVIAVLAAVLIPTFSDMIKKAQNSADLQEARNLFSQALIEEPTITSETIYIKVGKDDKVGYVKFENGQPKEVTDEEGNVIKKGDYTEDSIPESDKDKYVSGTGVFENIFRNICKHTNIETIPGTEATCTSIGYREGTRCSDCGKDIVPRQPISTKPHNYVNGVCSVCGAEENNEPDNTCAHTFVQGVCTSCAAKHYECSNSNCVNGINKFLTTADLKNYTPLNGITGGYYCLDCNSSNNSNGGYIRECNKVECDVCNKVKTNCEHTDCDTPENKGDTHSKKCKECGETITEGHRFYSGVCACGATQTSESNVVVLQCNADHKKQYAISTAQYNLLMANDKYTFINEYDNEKYIKCPSYSDNNKTHYFEVVTDETIEVVSYEYVCKFAAVDLCSNKETKIITNLDLNYASIRMNYDITKCSSCKRELILKNNLDTSSLLKVYHWNCTNPLCGFYYDLTEGQKELYFDFDGNKTITYCPNCLQNTLEKTYEHSSGTMCTDLFDLTVENIYKCVNGKEECGSITISPEDIIEDNWKKTSNTYNIQFFNGSEDNEAGIYCKCSSGQGNYKYVYSKEFHLICNSCQKNDYLLYNSLRINGETEIDCTCGGKFVICNGCDVHNKEKHEHAYETTTFNPTCTEDGYTEYVCNGCYFGNYSKSINKLGHTEVAVKGKEATCTEKGLTDGKKCSVCDVTLEAQTEIPAKGHTSVQISDKAATCTEPGLQNARKCSICDVMLSEGQVISPKGHVDMVGIKDCKCDNCDYTFEHVDNNNNCQCDNCNTSMHNIVNCVCTKCGYSEHTLVDCKCTKCGAESHEKDPTYCFCTKCHKTIHNLDENEQCQVCWRYIAYVSNENELRNLISSVTSNNASSTIFELTTDIKITNFENAFEYTVCGWILDLANHTLEIEGSSSSIFQYTKNVNNAMITIINGKIKYTYTGSDNTTFTIFKRTGTTTYQHKIQLVSVNITTNGDKNLFEGNYYFTNKNSYFNEKLLNSGNNYTSPPVFS